MKVELHLLFDGLVQTGKLYTLFIWPCFPYAHIILKTTSVRERIQKKGLFPSLNNTRAVRADLCSTKVSAGEEKYTLSCVTHEYSIMPPMICSDTLKLPCTQKYIWTYCLHTHTVAAIIFLWHLAISKQLLSHQAIQSCWCGNIIKRRWDETGDIIYIETVGTAYFQKS